MRLRGRALLGAWPACFSPSTYNLLGENAMAWAAARGLQMGDVREDDQSGSRFVHLPVSLLPTAYPQSQMDVVREAAPVFNLLVDRVSRDRSWLLGTLDEVSPASRHQEATESHVAGRLLQRSSRRMTSQGNS
jgi:hypothetical protein